MTQAIPASLRRFLNLSDLGSVPAARGNLSVYSIAQVDAADALKANKAGDTFSGNVVITNGTGNITLSNGGDLTTYRVGGTTGYHFFNAAQTKYLGFDGTNFQFQGATYVGLGGDPFVTRGASETLSGVKTLSAAIPLLLSNTVTGVRQVAVGDFYIDVSAGGATGNFYIRNGTSFRTDLQIQTDGKVVTPQGLYAGNGFGLLKADNFGYVVPGAGTNPAAYDPPTNGKMLFLASVPQLYIGNGSSWVGI